ncbi:unannotated protein [freshwater metagenome]|uniref:Unannotated protein n=1 Tax=freshwater metagenome TaxID=449393 RepID=A0A6J7LBV3_9ZZZZ
MNVYAVPFVSPVTTNGEAPPETVAPPGDAVTAYEVIAEPPLLTGATNPTVTSPLPRVPTTNVGAPGTVTAAPAVGRPMMRNANPTINEIASAIGVRRRKIDFATIAEVMRPILRATFG